MDRCECSHASGRRRHEHAHGLGVPDTKKKITGSPERGQNEQTAGAIGSSSGFAPGAPSLAGERQRRPTACAGTASSSARCSARTPARSSSWVRQENPSASTTASSPARPHGRQQVVLGDRHRHLVVALLDAEVAGQPAAAADPW